METELSTATTTSCMTDGVAMPNKRCILPFKFNGVLHKECTRTSAHLTGNKPWCSTRVNETGHHVRGHGNWGNCGPGCPIPPDHRQPPPLPVQKGMVTELPTEIIQPGITYDTILCHKSKPLSSKITPHQRYNFSVASELERSTTWLLYPLVASSSLLLAYLAFLIMKWGYSRSKLVQGWMRRLTGKSPKEEKMLLHTLPYYLAITRSSCEVS